MPAIEEMDAIPLFPHKKPCLSAKARLFFPYVCETIRDACGQLLFLSSNHTVITNPFAQDLSVLMVGTSESGIYDSSIKAGFDAQTGNAVNAVANPCCGGSENRHCPNCTHIYFLS